MIESLRTLKAVELRQLAVATGVSPSGTKELLSLRLQNVFQESALNVHPDTRAGGMYQKRADVASKSHLVLSIDMGIRNLAYCLISFPLKLLETERETSNANLETYNPRPTLHSWARIPVSRPPLDPKEREKFDSPTLAGYANDLIQNLVTTRDSATSSLPDTVLIERQRFRTAGGSAVQEWTIRVNLLEGMIWALLESAKRSNLWVGNARPMDAASINRWAATQNDGDTGIHLRKGAKLLESNGGMRNNKQMKVNLVGNWLSSRAILEVSNKSRGAVEDFLLKWTGAKSSKRSAGIGKLDDMADCLVQAMASFEWKRNRIRYSKRFS